MNGSAAQGAESAGRGASLNVLFAIIIVSLITTCGLSVFVGSGFWRYLPLEPVTYPGEYSYVVKGAFLEWTAGDHSLQILRPDNTVIRLPEASVRRWYAEGRPITNVDAGVLGRSVGHYSSISDPARMLAWDSADVYWSPSGPMMINLHTSRVGRNSASWTPAQTFRGVVSVSASLVLVLAAAYLIVFDPIRQRWRATDDQLRVAAEQHRDNRAHEIVYQCRCSNCGAPRVKDAPYCPYCGTHLVLMDANEADAFVKRSMREGEC
jgi:hypothetical protein